MEFLKSEDLVLNPAGYLVSKDNKPVYNKAYVDAQVEAHLFVSIANACKGKVFKVEAAAVFSDIVDSVKKEINASATHEYEKAPKKKKSILDEIAEAGLAFVEFESEVDAASKVNMLMKGFDSIRKVESVGEYFSEGVQELKKIYSIKEILTAAKLIVAIS